MKEYRVERLRESEYQHEAKVGDKFNELSKEGWEFESVLFETGVNERFVVLLFGRERKEQEGAQNRKG